MSEDAQKAFPLLHEPGSGAKGRSKAALVATESAFDLPALAEAYAVLLAFHLAAVRSRWPTSASVGVAAYGYDRRWNRQLFAAELVVVLRVVSLVTEDFVDRLEPDGLPNCGLELGRVLRRPHRNKRAQPVVRSNITDDREFGPGVPSVTTAEPPSVVATNVPALEPGGVDGCPAALRKLPVASCLRKECGHQAVEGPP